MSARNRRRPLEEIIAKREARRVLAAAPAAQYGVFGTMPKMKLHSIHKKRSKR